MKVGFYFVDQGRSEALVLLTRMLESVHRVMPDVPVVHLPDGLSGPLMRRRVEAYAACEGEWLFLDTDVLVQRDVQEVFADGQFDVAVASRAGTLRTKDLTRQYMVRMPYNAGVVFSRSPCFWRAVRYRLEQYHPKRQAAWDADQQALNEVIASRQFKVKILGPEYNYPPLRKDEDVSEKFITHLKGDRKAWLDEYA